MDIVFRSSIEAEYRAMANVASEVIWLQNLMHSLGFSIPLALMHCDNQAALHIVANPIFHERTKHIEEDCDFVCE